MKIKRFISAVTAAVCLAAVYFPTAVQAEEEHDDEWYFAEPEPYYYEASKNFPHPETGYAGYYIDDGYDLVYNLFEVIELHDTRCWRTDSKETDKTVRLYFKGWGMTSDGAYSYAKVTVRVPNTVNGIPVSEFYGSSVCRAYDVDPENKYFKSDGQTVFSKDGKILLSYARYNESTEYRIPDGTEIIGYRALADCVNLKKIYVPAGVKTVEAEGLVSAECIVFEDFDIAVDSRAFSYSYDMKNKKWQVDSKLVCEKTVTARADGNRIGWDKVCGASYYEIYQKLSGGEYKLLGRTKGTSFKVSGKKAGAEYTFAVKPIAVIPAANYGERVEETIRREYPESFTIEGTVSEDISVCI